MRFGSLFTGIGGFDLGFERAGMECAWQVEINEQCRQALTKHWPEVQRHDDVKTFNATIAIRPDVICGGFPCQDLSVAGKRAGLAGERSGLFYEFMRIVGEFTPEWVCIENVPGLLSSNGGRDMGAVLWTLGELGYGWCYRVLDAQFFGVAQRRRRVFIVGCAGDVRRAAEVLFEPDCLPWDSAPSREAGTSVAKTISGGAHPGGHNGQDDDGVIAAEPGMKQQTYAMQSMGVRRLMPVECERLQGFPDNWTAGMSDSARYRMLGNAVCVPVAEWIGKRLTQPTTPEEQRP